MGTVALCMLASAGMFGLVSTLLVGLLLLNPSVGIWRRIAEEARAKRDSNLARDWAQFAEPNGRKQISLPPTLPPRWIAITGYMATIALGGFGLELAPARGFLVLGVVLLSVLLWSTLLGWSRRPRLQLGVDGICLPSGRFIHFAELSAVTSSSPPEAPTLLLHRGAETTIAMCCSSQEIATRLAQVVDRARRLAPQLRIDDEEIPEARGFRESALQPGWRSRALLASSRDERLAAVHSVPPAQRERLRELLDESADPELEMIVHAQLGSRVGSDRN